MQPKKMNQITEKNNEIDVSVRKKIIKLHFQYISRDGTVGNKV